MRTMWVLTCVLAALTACGDSTNSAQSDANPPATTDASGQGGGGGATEGGFREGGGEGGLIEGGGPSEEGPGSSRPDGSAGAASSGNHGSDFYVDPNKGSDISDGTSPTTAFRTVARTQQAVRAVNGNMSADVHVHLLPGTSYMTVPLTLGGADSGTNGFDVWWEASPPGSAIMSGGYLLDSTTCIGGWTPTTFNTSIYQCKLPSGAAQTPTRDLYVDGARAQIAHTEKPFIPGTGTWITNNPACTACGPQGGTTGFTIQPGATPDISGWSLEGGTLWLVVEDNWRMHRGSIVQISGNQVIMDSHWWWATAGTGQCSMWSNWNVMWLENHIKLLDTPGEWYEDDAAHVLYYYPLANASSPANSVVVKGVLSSVVARDESTDPIHNIVFSGLSFAHTSFVPAYYANNQASITTVDNHAGGTNPDDWDCGDVPDPVASAACSAHVNDSDPNARWGYFDFAYENMTMITTGLVELHHTKDLRFEGCTFEHAGGAGAVFGRGTQSTTVETSTFSDIAESGIVLGLPMDHHVARSSPDYVIGNTFTQNLLQDIGTVYWSGVGIMAFFTDSTTITHNEIHDVSYSGLSVGLGWGMWDYRGYNQYGQGCTDFNASACRLDHGYNELQYSGGTQSKGNIIANNLVYRVQQNLNDGGGIYVQGAQLGSQILENVVVNVGQTKFPDVGYLGSWSLYLDDASAHFVVERNVVYDDPTNAFMAKNPSAQTIGDVSDGANTNYFPPSWSNSAGAWGYCYTGGCPNYVFPSSFMTFTDAPTTIQQNTGRTGVPLNPASWL
jgi:hypothetical protein